MPVANSAVVCWLSLARSPMRCARTDILRVHEDGRARSLVSALPRLAPPPGQRTGACASPATECALGVGIARCISCYHRRPLPVILNGHEYVAVAAQAAGIGFAKEGNCFTGIADPQGLAQIADTLPQDAAVGRLGQVGDRWIYSACLCFGLDLAEQARSGFRYAYSACQAEYSRNLIFGDGRQLDRVVNTVAGRTRSRLDVPALRTLFGARRPPLPNRPVRNRRKFSRS
jgi:hypothetical protein